MKEIQFSVIIPVYKVERYLERCVDSILNQDLDNFEIILVDDGSPDDCPQICDKYAADSARIKVIHKTNGGLSDARNVGLAHAHGIYVTFVDSDDFWKGIDVLSGIWNVITNNDYPDVVVCDFYKYYDKVDKYVPPVVVSDEQLNGQTKLEILKYLYFRQADLKMSAWQKFVKRDILNGISFEKGLLSEDIDWTLQIYTTCRSICLYSKPFYCYRQLREGSITRTASTRSFNSLIYIIEKWKDKLSKMEIDNTEKNIYRGYLAFQLSIAINLLNRLPRNERTEGIKILSAHKDLFNGSLNSKTQNVALFIKIFGFSTTSKILKQFLKFRRWRQSNS